jgi:hypothetical protein
MFFVPPPTCTHGVTCCEYLGVPNFYLMGVPNEDTTFFRIVGTLLNLLDQGLNWMLRFPSQAHMFKVDFLVDRSDVAVILEDVVQHVSCRDVGVDHHIVVQDVHIHWFKNIDYLLVQRLLHGGACLVSMNVLFPNVACGADLGLCSIRVGWYPPGGLWACPKCWARGRC